MKKVLFLTAMFLLVSLTAFAQDETKVALGLGLEWNMNSRENFAGGASLNFDYNLFRSFAAGLAFTASTNFNSIIVLEPATFFRWYFLRSDHTGLFAQAEAGGFIVLEDADITALFMGGLAFGYRLPLGRFYVEPYGRVGYPFVFGAGVIAGLRF